MVIRVGRGGFLSISLSHVATLHFLLDVFFRFSSHSPAGVCTLFFIVEHFSGGCFSNNQHFSVFYITFWNCFTDLVPFFLPSFVELVLYICMYIIDL